jgi:hypothetical protein
MERMSRKKVEHRAVKEKAQRLLAVTSGRKCGDCQECCWVPEIPELGQQAYERCPHQCESGCGVYDKRPTVCRDFTCLWLSGQFEEKHRPDRIGLAVQDSTLFTLAYFGVPHIIVYSAVPRAELFCNSERMKLLFSLAATGTNVIIDDPEGRAVMGPDAHHIVSIPEH